MASSDISQSGTNSAIVLNAPIPVKGLKSAVDGSHRRNDLSEDSENEFSPIIDTDREELETLATQLHRSESLRSTVVQAQSEMLERFDSAQAHYGDEGTDPTQPDFNVYKWARMQLHLMNEKGIVSSRSGVTFQGLDVYGSGPRINIQPTVATLMRWPLQLRDKLRHQGKRQILYGFEGLIKPGELLVVLGRPGGGCSTFLRSITGRIQGLVLGPEAVVEYNGIPQYDMQKHFKGETLYMEEIDQHFPHLTVRQTLEFAAAARTPQTRAFEGSRDEWVKHITRVMMAVFGISHTANTKVGNEFVRGVSGGERKRVSIAETALAGANFVAWDNSTRGLDSATALQFVKSLRMSANMDRRCYAVAIYQASQQIYDQFDRVILLYEGREIFFGPGSRAKAYFEDMGWFCPARQTTGDFLTSITNPQERQPREGEKHGLPQTPEDFENYWHKSEDYLKLQMAISNQKKEFPLGDKKLLTEFRASHKAKQAKHVPTSSPYTISTFMQIRLCIDRSFLRLWNDKTSTVTTVVAQAIFSLVIASIFYGPPPTTDSFVQKGGLIYFAALLNALIASIEINGLFEQRPIVEKHKSYAFYRPWTEALAGFITNLPIKLVAAVAFNLILYFLAGLRPTAANFFIFLLFTYTSTITMSTIFRTMAAVASSNPQAHMFAGLAILALVVYTGYIIPMADMHPWFKWITYINPLSYAFESLLLNEMHGRNFTCARRGIIPAYPGLSGPTFICPVIGAVAGEDYVSGDAWMESAFQYRYSHLWRNFGILMAFLIGFLIIYLLITQWNTRNTSTGEVLVFRRGHVPSALTRFLKRQPSDEKVTPIQIVAASQLPEAEVFRLLEKHTGVYTWDHVTYDIHVKEGTRRLLDEVNGWVKPGELTALMGVSGAGKTTLLDVLAERTRTGVIRGDFLASGKQRDPSFQRQTGYVQQLDLHLSTTTVREALRFSAYLRQPKSVPKAEKWKHVENVIQVLGMDDFSEAIVGIPGQGLNVHQRKLLTIGVELAAKPGLLLFLDEPTSGLDSQSSWSIIALLKKLSQSGQAVLSTIHQPSSTLFQQFDRILFLGTGGKTIYFGETGRNSRTMLDYFERHGARNCKDSENPAEYMLEICGEKELVGKVDVEKDWHEIWRSSEEFRAVNVEIKRINKEVTSRTTDSIAPAAETEFAMPLYDQVIETTYRCFSQYWRTPNYIWGKVFLAMGSSLFIGFSFFQPAHSIQGIQDVVFGVFMITTIFSSMMAQVYPRFVEQRSLYESRERPSKAYSWKAFLIANILVEIPWQILVGVIIFACFNYPIFGIQSAAQQGLILLFIVQFFVYASLFGQMIIAAMPDASTAGAVGTIMFAMCLVFNGVFQTKEALPGFWIFMYRVSPMTYLISGIVSTALHDRAINCAANEIAVFQPLPTLNCGQYMQKYLAVAPGQLLNPSATTNCEFCPLSGADQYISGANIYYSTRWRDYGIGFSYLLFNAVMIVTLYYTFRVRRWGKRGE